MNRACRAALERLRRALVLHQRLRLGRLPLLRGLLLLMTLVQLLLLLLLLLLLGRLILAILLRQCRGGRPAPRGGTANSRANKKGGKKPPHTSSP
eukprot:COSAG01_NODE_23054_length_830_cov_0.972640_1_plen_95_part_00